MMVGNIVEKIKLCGLHIKAARFLFVYRIKIEIPRRYIGKAAKI